MNYRLSSIEKMFRMYQNENDRNNKEDAKNTAYRLFGYNRALNIRIENTQLKTAY